MLSIPMAKESIYPYMWFDLAIELFGSQDEVGYTKLSLSKVQNGN